MHSAVYDLVPFVLLLTLVGQVLPQKCVTPDRRQGNCISLYSCEAVGHAILGNNSEAIEFVRRSNCGGTAVRPKVCCLSHRKVPASKPPSTTAASKESLSADRRSCGYQHAHKFPWLAHFIYEDESGNRSATFRTCNGVLITNRYVLTTNACTAPRPIWNTTKLTSIRIGDFDTEAEKGCVKCSSRFEEVGVETAMRYTGLNQLEPYYNLVLVRLNRTVEYSDYIRPICLPQPSTAPKFGDTVAIAGWESQNHTSHFKKHKFTTKMVDDVECELNTRFLGEYKHHWCVSPEAGAQNEFFAAPLMFSVRNQWQIEGIYQVGMEGYEMYIKVANYVEWIEQNVKL